MPSSNHIQEVEDGGASTCISSTEAVDTEYQVASSTGTPEDVISGNGIPAFVVLFCIVIVYTTT